MKRIKRNSIIAVGLTALSTLALGIGAIALGTAKEDSTGLKGSYNLTAYAEESSTIGVKKITVAGKEIDVSETATFNSTDGEYTLCLTVVDIADFGENFNTPLQVGYEIAEDTYYNGTESGLCGFIYSSLTFADGSSLVASNVSLTDFKTPYFIVAEVLANDVNKDILNCIVGEKHTTELVSGQAATCAADGWKNYYKCTDDGCTKYFTDSWGVHEIADLAAFKTGDGKIQAFGHTEVIDEAKAATCTETGLTEGKHCSVCGEVLVAQSVLEALGHRYDNHICSECGDLEKFKVNGVYYQLTANSNSDSYYFVVSGKADDFATEYYANEANTFVLENEIDGFPVTEIAAEALSNKNGNASTSIKNIVVPSNIGKVGERAFLDNYNIKSAVFLANEVIFYGKAGSTATMPFYGCSIADGGSTTRIAVYYHTITAYNGGNWDQFRYNSGLSRGYIIRDAGGALVSSGWDYATAKAVVDLKGVEGSTLTEDAANEILAKYYPVFSTTTFEINADIEASLTTDFAQFDMIKDGISYKCVFTSELTTVGLYSVVTYTVSYEEAAVLNVVSGVEFTYYGTTVTANSQTEVVVAVTDGNLVLENPVAEGYVFLGYACEDGESLIFSDYSSIVSAEKTLYVIWGGTRTEISVEINSSGTSTLNDPTGESLVGKWYKDRDSWEEVTEISKTQIVVYTRSQFTASVAINGKNSTYYLNGNKELTSKKKDEAMSYIYKVSVLEGETFSVIANNSNECIITVKTVEGKTSSDIIYVNAGSWNLIGTKYTESGNRRTFTLSGGDVTDVTVEGNLNYTITY